MNVWLVNPFDLLPGEQARIGRYAFFAKMFGEAGHTVTWWVSAFHHVTKSYRNIKEWRGHFIRWHTSGYVVGASILQEHKC